MAQDAAVEVDVVEPSFRADEADGRELVFGNDTGSELPHHTGDRLTGTGKELDVGLAGRHAGTQRHRTPWKCLDWQAKLNNLNKKSQPNIVSNARK